MEALLLLAALPVLWLAVLLTAIWLVPGLLVVLAARATDAPAGRRP